MGIAIEGLTIVVRLDRVADLLNGGVEALKALGNASAGHDDHLWRCCFMADSDGEALFQCLRSRGLNEETGADPDMVLVDEFDLQVRPYCEWLKIHRSGKAVFAWLDGTTPETVVATPGWSFENGSGLQRHRDDDEHLEFLRVDGDDIEVYFDKALNKEVYLARQSPSNAAIEWRFQKASKRIQALWIQPGQPPVSGSKVDEIRGAIDELAIIVTHAPDAWLPHFMMGKGWQAIGEMQKAFDSLKRANELATEHEVAPREFAGLCLQLGLAKEAVQAAEQAAALRPDNHESLGNLACAYIIAERHSEAMKTIDAALKLHPDDRVNRTLHRMIGEIVAGRRPQARCLKDLMEAPHKLS